MEPTWNWKKADWDIFHEVIMEKEINIPPIINQETCDRIMTDFYAIINEAMTEAIPKTKTKIIDKNNPWWTDELQAMRKRLNKLYRTSKRKPSTRSINAYKQVQSEYAKKCDKVRNNAWADFKEKLDSLEAVNRFRKIIEKHIKVRIGTLVKEDGTITDPGKDTITYLMKTHFPSAIELEPTKYNINKYVTIQEVEEWECDWITKDKVMLAFRGFDNKKSPGTDNLKPTILKHLPHKMLNYIICIYKCTVMLEFTPTIWKDCKLVFIPKPGKERYDVPKAWRPISLTNYLLKALERLCGWKMDEALEAKPVHTRQHGFRTDRNTETAISAVANYIERNIFNNRYVIGTFLDIQAAFDTIKPSLIKRKLLEHGGDEKMVNWYYNYITHRNLHAEINGEKYVTTTKIGFPQGGVCSAKFWIIAFNDAINIINTHGAYGNGFADDCVVLTEGTNLYQMMSRMQKVVTELEQWGETAGLKFNASKTEVLIFTRKTVKQEKLPNKLIVSNSEVEYGTQAKYLGVLLDNKLNWNAHFEKTIKKAKMYLFMLKKAVIKSWGPKPNGYILLL